MGDVLQHAEGGGAQHGRPDARQIAAPRPCGTHAVQVSRRRSPAGGGL